MGAWRLLETWDGEPAFNMGLDEVLLYSSDERPTLRFYTWAPAALSLGYFQPFDSVPAAERAGVVVRRLTGGGAIHHSRELTFSISAALDHPLYRGPLTNSYRRVHSAIAAALVALGVSAHMRGDDPARSDREGTGMCFHESTPLDLVWGGLKGLGSAQRRTAGRVLHHGSLKIGTTPLEGNIATLEGSASDGGMEAAALAKHLVGYLGAAFDASFERAEPGTGELQEAAERGARFTAEAFLHRR